MRGRREAAVFVGLLLAGPAWAQTQQPQGAGAAQQNPLTQPAPDTVTYVDGPVSAHLLGDLGGLRTDWHNAGIDLRANLVSEEAGNVSGGKSQALRSANEFNFGADVDLGKLGIDPNGTVHITFTQRWGRSLSQDAVGNLVSVQEIYGTGEDFRLTEASFEQSFLNNHVDIELGRVITENDFGLSPTLWDKSALYCVFQNNGICGTPVGVPVNSGYDAYPQSTWGGRVRVMLTDTILAQTGAYEVNPTLGDSSNGLKISTNGDTGAFIPFEIGWRPGHSITGEPDTEGTLPGDYRLGVYYDTSHVTDPYQNIPGTNLPAVSMQSYTGRSGFYVTAAQTVWRTPSAKPGDPRSLSVFGAVNVGDAATSLYRVYAEAGVVLKGTFPGRDDDTVGLAATDVEINSRRRDEESLLLAQGFDVTGKQVREMAFELNYTAPVYHGISVEPGVQLVLHPGAVSEIPHAWIFDLRTSVKF